MATTISYDDGFLYSKSKAEKGVLERVVVKRVVVPDSNLPVPSPMYVDTLNCTWMPSELVTGDVATSLAQEYLQGRLNGLQ